MYGMSKLKLYYFYSNLVEVQYPTHMKGFSQNGGRFINMPFIFMLQPFFCLHLRT